MFFADIYKSLVKNREKKHEPCFRAKREKDGFRFFDGDRAIAKIYTEKGHFDVWAFSPFEADIKINPEPRKAVDIYTMQNTVFNLGSAGWPAEWKNSKNGFPQLDADLKKEGHSLEFELAVKAAGGEYGKWLFKVKYDPAGHRYSYGCLARARKKKPTGMEAFNLMAVGALSARVENRRWTHSVWENPDGKIRSIVHSNALFFATDFGNDGQKGGPWRRRNLPYPKAWIGYAADALFNPFIMINNTNVPVAASTCSQLFDEHIIWKDAGQDNLGKDGFFHFRMDMEIINMSFEKASELLKNSAGPVKPRRWGRRDVCLPFYFDIANDLEKQVDPWQPEECPVLIIPSEGNKTITWDDNVSCSGRRSIKFSSVRTQDKTELHPVGAPFEVREKRKYRFSCAVKTENVERFARIELFTYEYKYSNRIDSAISKKVAGSIGWKKLNVEFKPDGGTCIMPSLVLYGKGRVWFDDLRLEEINA